MGSLGLAFWFFVAMRPRIDISPVISETHDREGTKCYKFKFINNSLFSAYDVRVEAYVCIEALARIEGKAINVDLDKIDLTRNEWIHVERWRLKKTKDFYTPHCLTVRTYDNFLPKIMDNNNYIIFRVTLKI